MNARQELIDRYLSDRTTPHRDAVVAAHLYLCKRGARKFRRAESEPADLEQVAAIGLLKATDTYCRDRTTPFEAYAWIVIVGELMHYVRDSERAIRIPRALRSLERRYVAAWERLAAQHHMEPTTQQLATALDVSTAVIEQLQTLRHTPSRESDATLPRRIESLAAPERGPALEERLTLAMALAELDDRERTIVLGTYGAGLSQNEIAMKLRLSQSQISKLLARALGKLSKKVA